MNADPPADRARTRSAALIVAATLIGFVVLVLAFETPYDAAELDQVRTYDQPLGEVAEASYEQGQPPLLPNHYGGELPPGEGRPWYLPSVRSTWSQS